MLTEKESLERKYTRVDKSFFSSIEERILYPLAYRFPAKVKLEHLVTLSLLWSIVNIALGFLSKVNRNWLWVISLVIILQIISDYLDGTLGRLRHTGLILWGYYMDHLLDYVFLCSMLAVYFITLGTESKSYLVILMAIFVGFMVHTFLSFSASGEFRISYFGIGPTEVRIIFICYNIYLYFFGDKYNFWIATVVILLSIASLIILVYQTQKKLWHLDLQNIRLEGSD
jgi:archaetidylinositol phosphate synthase